MSAGKVWIAAHQAKAPPSTATAPGVFRLKTPRTRLVQKEKEKKMGWLKRKFAKWSREAWEDSKCEDMVVSSRSHDSISGKSSVRFTIYPASGGFVIEHYKQDRYHEHDGPTLTIVKSSDDIGQAVEHILAIEALKA